MDNENILQQQLPHVLLETDFEFLPNRYQGKVRDCYADENVRFLITTDRLSCFDRVVTTVPFKGQVLNQLAVYWFNQTGNIVNNQLIEVPDPNVMLVRNCQIVPVEVVVRAYLTGSAWRDYQAGKTVSGLKLPAGLRQNQALPEIVVTPSTKAQIGDHDQPISETEIIAQGVVEESIWQKIRQVSLELFTFGSEMVARNGLILVDTKYEFGLYQGELILADELHTLDSSRFWVTDSYQDLLEKGEPQIMLDKEPTRQWLLQQGFKGDGDIPHFSDQHRIAIARHYINAYERISGEKFQPLAGPVVERIERALRGYYSH